MKYIVTVTRAGSGENLTTSEGCWCKTGWNPALRYWQQKKSRVFRADSCENEQDHITIMYRCKAGSICKKQAQYGCPILHIYCNFPLYSETVFWKGYSLQGVNCFKLNNIIIIFFFFYGNNFCCRIRL